jgi:hypothetical protein
MTRARLWLVTAAFVLWPGVASAQFMWWEWMESLSGPGPFLGIGVGVRVACADGPGFTAPWTSRSSRECFNDNVEQRRQTVEVRASFFSTGEGKRPRLIVAPADTREVRALKVEALTALRVAPFLDLGAGGGFIRFTGEGFDPVLRASIIPFSATFTPLAIRGATHPLRRLIKIRIEEMYIPFGFRGVDWGNTTVSPLSYSTDGNWVFSGGLIVDFGNWR